MAQDRHNIDLKGLRDRIEAHSTDPAWKALSMSAKIRLLIELGLERADRSPDERLKTATIAQLVEEEWETVTTSEVDISVRRLQEIRRGEKPTDEELVELGTVLPFDTHQLIEIRDRTFDKPNGKPNGQPSKRM